MQSRCTALFVLLATIVVPLTLESAPAPKVPVRAVIQFVKPPKGMALKKYRDQKLIEVRACVPRTFLDLVDLAKADVDINVRTDKGQILHYSKDLALSIKEQKDPWAWLKKNLRIEPSKTGCICIRFTTGSKAEQAFFINALVGTYLSLSPTSRRLKLQHEMEHTRERLFRYKQELAEDDAGLVRDQIKADIKEAEASLRKIQTELEDETPEPVIRWAKE